MALSARLPLMGVEEAKELMQVVLGSKKADLAIINVRLANVYTGELLDNYAVTLKGKWIAYVGKEPHDSIGPETVVIDAEGMTIIPGLIDGHAHLANIYDSSEFLRYAIKGGTTTIIAETMEVLLRLHPTPAVGGFPRETALAAIRELEHDARGWYAGPVGWIARDQAEFAVAIRSAMLRERDAIVFAGAGIVAGSVPQREWRETEDKAHAFLKALS